MRRFALLLSTVLGLLAALPPAAAQDQSSNLAVAAKGGWWDADVTGVDGGPSLGLEVSMDDAFLRPAVGKLRHMWSWNHADNDGLELDTAEWNAHWVFETRPDLWIGAGPGIGWVWADGRDRKDSFGLQIGASATYLRGHALFGFESRYQWTEGSGADNWLNMVKVGYRF